MRAPVSASVSLAASWRSSATRSASASSAVTSSLLAIPDRLLPVCRGPGAALGRRGAVGGGPLSVLRRPLRDVRPLLAGPRGVARRELAIVQRRGLIARRRRQVASAGDGVPCSGRVDPRLGGLPAAAPRSAREGHGCVVHGAVGPLGEVTIARFLIRVRRSLVAVGGGLVAVRTRLVRVRERLILIGEGLTGVGLSGAAEALPLVALGLTRLWISFQVCLPRSSIGPLRRTGNPPNGR